MQEKTAVLSAFVIFGLILIGSITYFIQPTSQDITSSPTLIDWSHLQNDPASFKNGEYQFKVRCNSCHGMNGEGSTHGATLNDETWIHGNGSLNDIFNTIYEGVPNTEMKGLKGKLRTKDIQDIAIYVQSFSKK